MVDTSVKEPIDFEKTFLQTLSTHWCRLSKLRKWHPCWSQKKYSRMKLPGKEKMRSFQERYQKGSSQTSTMLIFSWTLAPPDQPLRSSQLHSGSDACTKHTGQLSKRRQQIKLLTIVVEDKPVQGSSAGLAIDTAPKLEKVRKTNRRKLSGAFSNLEQDTRHVLRHSLRRLQCTMRTLSS